MKARFNTVALALAVLLISLMATGTLRAGETELASPEPSMDDPRKIVFSLNTKDPSRVNSILYNVVNVQKFYGIDNVEITVVGWGPGVRPLLKKDSTVAKRISSLQQYNIEFIACKNTLDAIGDRYVEGLIDGVEWVEAGLPEIVEKRLNGWVDLWP